VAALTGVLESSNSWARLRGAEALWKIDQHPEAISALIALLEDADPNVRRAATAILGEVGPPAKEALPAIQALLEDSDERVRESAASALQKID
jgi:HEAT repeat protein